jgi:phenylalanyl-tRNA synthetase beta chain
MCSPKELGISADASGLLILPDDAPVGKLFAEYLGKAKPILYMTLKLHQSPRFKQRYWHCKGNLSRYG